MPTFGAAVGDGQVALLSASTWATVRGASSGSESQYTLDYTSIASYKNGTTYAIYRSFFPFDTSAIPDSETIASATLTLYPNGVCADGVQPGYLVAGTQASTSSLSTSDYNKVGSAALSDNTCDFYDGFPNGKTFTLNAAGLAAISKTGYTKLAVREGRDFNDVAPTTITYAQIATSAHSTPGYRPLLTVNYGSSSQTIRAAGTVVVTSGTSAGVKRTAKSAGATAATSGTTSTARAIRRSSGSVVAVSSAFGDVLSSIRSGASVGVVSGTVGTVRSGIRSSGIADFVSSTSGVASVTKRALGVAEVVSAALGDATVITSVEVRAGGVTVCLSGSSGTSRVMIKCGGTTDSESQCLAVARAIRRSFGTSAVVSATIGSAIANRPGRFESEPDEPTNWNHSDKQPQSWQVETELATNWESGE